MTGQAFGRRRLQFGFGQHRDLVAGTDHGDGFAGQLVGGPAFELTREADETFAMLVDYFRDYRDCADAYAETQKFEVYDEMQSQINALKALGVSLRYAERKMQVKWGSTTDGEPMPVNMLYVVAFPLGK